MRKFKYIWKIYTEIGVLQDAELLQINIIKLNKWTLKTV